MTRQYYHCMIMWKFIHIYINIIYACCFMLHFRLFTFSEDLKQFRLYAASAYHNHCVLQVKHFLFESTNQISAGNRTQTTNQKRVFILSAGTDGRVALWDISTLLCELYHATGQSQSRTENISRVSDPVYSQTTGSSGSQTPIADVQDLGSPVWSADLHQSGVNALDIRQSTGTVELLGIGTCTM